ncbi:MAG TPA: NUDIX hydrolase [Acidimicrobiales bacterium]|nr:NUDIX hydrolase [Acidimicrobiales bacterium]
MAGEGPVEVRAGGGLVLRPSGAGVEVLLVHRPRYDDWSLPKGKARPGESDEACARREVEEETGLCCRLGPELPPVRYVDRKGRAKRVRYWEMTVEGGAFTPNDEVDEVRWVAAEEAAALLTYDHDVALVTSAPRPGG